MATASEANALGFITPAPTDLVSNGDDAIKQNALATVDLYNENKAAAAAARWARGGLAVHPNDLTQSGIYWTAIANAAEYGLPKVGGTYAQGALEHFEMGATAGQRWTNRDAEGTFSRGRDSSGAWSPWVQDGAKALSDLQNSIAPAIATALVGSLRPRGPVPAGTDLNTMRGTDWAGIWELDGSRSYPNAPFAAAGQLIVTAAGPTVRQTAVRYAAQESWSRQTLSTTAWYDWAGTDVQQPPAGISLDALRANSEIVIRNSTDAAKVTAGWPDNLGIPRVAARLSVRCTSTGLVFQTLQTYGTDPRLLIRSTANTQSTPFPFSPWVDATSPSVTETRVQEIVAENNGTGAPVALAHQLLMEDFTRRRPVVRTGGRPALALRFDHGLANFSALIVPVLKRLGLPAALALNAGDWDRSENSGVTASMVNTWVSEGWLEIWNHSLNHIAPPTDPAALSEQIVMGLSKLRSDLPAAVIDGYMPAGTAGDTSGFNGGDTLDAWWNTAPGRLILQTHAVASGYLSGTAYRTLDGTPRQGQSHYTVDTLDVDTIKTRIQGAYTPATSPRGVQLMLHPSRLDTAGYMTSADFTALLEWIAAERDAGRLLVLGAYDLLRADSSK